MKKKNLIITNQYKPIDKNVSYIGTTSTISFLNTDDNYEKIIFPELKREEILNNYAFCNNVSKKLLKSISANLNSIHNENFQTNFWDIIIGTWLKDYVETMFKIYSQVKFTLENYEINKIIAIKELNYDFSPLDTLYFRKQINDDQWYFLIFSKIISFLRASNNFDFSHESTKDFKDITVLKKNTSNKSITKIIKIYNFFFKQIKFFVNFNNYSVITKTMLPLHYEKFLELKNYQLPTFYSSEQIKQNSKKDNMREKLEFEKNEQDTNFEKFLKENLSKFLPKSCVENYQEIKKIAIGKRFPENPKFIFTSESFAYDEVFKIYAAIKKEKKIPFFLGQHGNKYFTRIKNNFRPETSIADKFISWGAEKNSFMKSKVEPAFNFKTAGKKFKKENSKKIILFFPWVVSNLHSLHTMENDLFNFLIQIKDIILKLDEHIKENIILRFNASYFNNFFGVKYFDLFKDLKCEYDNGQTPVKNLYKKSKLNFFILESTGVLESFHYKIPTIFFNEKNFIENINYNYINKYKMLLNNNILFTDKKKIINHINVNWEHTFDWWNSKKEIITKFNKDLNNYSNIDGIKKLGQILNQ